MIIITRQVGGTIVIGSGPSKISVTIHRIGNDRIALSVENAATVVRGETADAVERERAAEERPAE